LFYLFFFSVQRVPRSFWTFSAEARWQPPATLPGPSATANNKRAGEQRQHPGQPSKKAFNGRRGPATATTHLPRHSTPLHHPITPSPFPPRRLLVDLRELAILQSLHPKSCCPFSRCHVGRQWRYLLSFPP